jgi:hypothetical protein
MWGGVEEADWWSDGLQVNLQRRRWVEDEEADRLNQSCGECGWGKVRGMFV